jgi:peptide/nickel transport system permease protein
MAETISDDAVPAAIVDETAAPASESGLRRLWRSIISSPQAAIGFLLVAVMVTAAVAAPWIAPQDPYDLTKVTFMDSMIPPGGVGSAGFVHVFGTDAQGRDLLSAILYGLRASIFVSVTATMLAMAIGLLVGLTAAYLGGRFDSILMRVVDVQISIPTLLIALVLVSALGSGIDKLILALVAIYWAYFARVTRGTALSERRKEYIEAAICLALPKWRIVLRHLLVNSLPPIMVVATVLLARAVLLEAGLSYLGLGVPITKPSLGLLIANGFSYLMSGNYWVSTYPGIALVMLIFGVNLVGDHLRDVLNPRLHR